MKKRLMVTLATGALALTMAVPTAAVDQSCWGRLSAAFAQAEVGLMGAHASQQAEPRDGLRNLARYLYKDGVLADDSLATLGAYLDSIDPSIEVDACA